MIWSSANAAVHRARSVDDLIAAEWALEDLSDGAGQARFEEVPISRGAAPAEEATPLRAAEEERERAVAEAYARGFEEGRALGEKGEAARLRSAVLAAERALEELREGEIRWTGAIEENICALAVAVARHVIGRELKGDSEVVGGLVRRALAEFPVDQPIRIRVNPMDLAAIEGSAEGGALDVTRGRDARWISDPRIHPGGCVVEGRERIVDGRVDNGLERIYRRLTYNHV